MSSSSPQPNLERFGFSQIDDAPEGPGLYAWYGQIAVGQHDWAPSGLNEEEGAKRLMRLLLKHSKRFVGGSMSVRATYSYDAKWFGRLKDQSAKEFVDCFSSDFVEHKRQTPFSILQSLLSQQNTRGALVNLLGATTPVITAPIYIGKARSLKQRLMQHRDRILLLHDRLVHEPEYRTRLPIKPIFADRAVSLGFTPDLLHVYTMDLSPLLSDTLDRKTLERLAIAVETLLNRWHRPLLGRK